MAKNGVRGFGLLELLVALGLLGVVTISFSRFFSSSLKGSRNIANRGEYGDLLDSVRLVLKNSAMCKCNLAPQTPAPRSFLETATASTVFPIDAIHRYSSSCVSGGVLAGMSLPIASGLKIRGMSLRDFFKVDESNYMAKLHLDVDKPAGSVGGPGYAKDFQIAFKTTTSQGRVTLNECVIEGEEENSGPPTGTFWSLTVSDQNHDSNRSGRTNPSFVVPEGKALVITQVSLGGLSGTQLSLENTIIGYRQPSLVKEDETRTVSMVYSGSCFINGARIHSVSASIPSSASMGSPLALGPGTRLEFSRTGGQDCTFSGFLTSSSSIKSGTFWSFTVSGQNHDSNRSGRTNPSFVVPEGKALVITQVSLSNLAATKISLENTIIGYRQPSLVKEDETRTVSMVYSGSCFINGARVHSVSASIPSSASMGTPLALSSGTRLDFSRSGEQECTFSGYLMDDSE